MVIVLMLIVNGGNDREDLLTTEEKYGGLTWRLLVQLNFPSVRPNNKQICLMKCKITSIKPKAQSPKPKTIKD
jgi:hypothetical protein